MSFRYVFLGMLVLMTGCIHPVNQCVIQNCTPVYELVCTESGTTYINPCTANCANETITSYGECEEEPVPEACPDVWDPVCGTDGRTYSNTCYAAMNLVDVDYDGVCVEPETPCTDSSDCPAGEYCSNRVCREVPEVCPRVWDPVCGTDGRTYSNECYAAMNRVYVDYYGACEEEEVPCTDSSDCPEGEYCSSGACREAPEACIDVWDPVCGTDGRTYSNTCYAAMNLVDVDYDGVCVEPETPCTDSSDCPAGEYCSNRVCREVPVVCPDVWDPVCGTDGRTYSNECYAAMNLVDVDYRGQCVEEPDLCTNTNDCPRGEVCTSGVCSEPPIACIDIWNPVCGTDGRTYSNTCYAAMNLVDVDYDGVCVEPETRCTDYTDCPLGEYCYDGVCIEPKLDRVV